MWCEALPSTAPANAPMMSRVVNCGGVLRLGVLGSWSVISSTTRKIVRTVTVIGWAIQCDHLSPTSIHPRNAPHATTAGAVSARRPAMTPIAKASRITMTCVMRTSRAVETTSGR